MKRAGWFGTACLVSLAATACSQSRATHATGATGVDARLRSPAPTPSPPTPQTPAVPIAVAAEPASCVSDGRPYGEAALAAHLTFLASRDLDGRAPGTPGDRTARAHIVERFACLGLTPAGSDATYEQSFTAGEGATANVIGFIPGIDADVGHEIVLVGAHHDHIGNGHLGANDNASGVTAMLAIAQAIRQQGTPPRRTIAFAAFGAEELGMIGSSYFAANAPAALPIANVVQFINLDMVGSHDSKGYVAAMGTFAKMPSRALLGTLDDRYPTIDVGIGGRAYRSDHLPFCERGIPYVFFWTPDARCYHETCDRVGAIDLPHMAAIASLAGDLVSSLASTKTDLAAARTKLGCHGR